MAIKRLLGYLIAIVGIIIFATGFIQEIGDLIKIPGLSDQSDYIIIAIGLVIILIGLFLVVRAGKGKSKKIKEVPIYRGKNIVGYRRH